MVDAGEAREARAVQSLENIQAAVEQGDAGLVQWGEVAQVQSTPHPES